MPGEELDELPPLTGLHPHAFRWDHALPSAVAARDEYPTDITVYLIEAESLEPGRR